MVQSFFSNMMKISDNALILNEEENTGRQTMCLNFTFAKKKIIPKSTSLIPPRVVNKMLLPLTSRWMVLLM